MIVVLYTIILLLFSIYSYSLIDVNITFFNHKYWTAFRNVMVDLGYNQRELSSFIYVVFIITLFGFFIYFIRNHEKFSPIKLALITGFLLLFSYPFLSHDLFNYIFDAKIVTAYHQNPYLMRPQDFPFDPWLRFMHWTHRTYPYGPSFLIITLLPSLIAGGKFILNFIFFKSLFVLLYITAVYFLNKINRRLAVFFAVHPLVIIEGLVNTHNDFLAVSIGLIGISLLLNSKYTILSRLILLLSAGIKYLTLPIIFLKQKSGSWNKLIFLSFILIMGYVSLTLEIHPWYMLNFLVFIPFFYKEISIFNFFSLGLLLSQYFIIRYGVINQEWQMTVTNILVFIFFSLNVFFLFIKNNLLDKKSKSFTLTLIIILIVAAIVRFHGLEKTAFFVNDQGRDLLVLLQMAASKKPVLIGPATSLAADLGNIYFGPFYYYFLFPFFLLNNSAMFMTMIIPFFSFLSLFLLTKIKEPHAWKKIFSLIFIGSSWYVIYYSRFLWNLNLGVWLSLILFSIFFIWSDRILKNPVLILVFGLFSGAIWQIHYGTLFLYAAFVFLMVKWRNIILYVLGILISFLPFVLFDLRHNNVLWRNFVSLLSQFNPFASTAKVQMGAILSKVFNYYIFPFNVLPSAIKSILITIIFFSILWVLIRKKSLMNDFLFWCFIIFPLTYFVFKRDFDYYLLCFAVWFYMGLSILLYEIFQINKITRIIVLSLIYLFFVINLVYYFSLPKNMFSLNRQEILAGAISFYHNKWFNDERKKGNKIDYENLVVIDVYPHADDVRGLEFILKSKYNLQLSKQKGRKFFVCYYDFCKTEIRVYNGETKTFILLPDGKKINFDDFFQIYGEDKNLKAYAYR